MDLSLYHDAILHGIARALFTRAWIDYQEEFDTGAIQPDSTWHDLLPSDNDPAAVHAAIDIEQSLASLNQGRSITELYKANAGKASDPTLFGLLVGMQAIESDDSLQAAGITLNVPSYDFGWIDLEGDYFPAIDHALPDDAETLLNDITFSSAVRFSSHMMLDLGE